MLPKPTRGPMRERGWGSLHLRPRDVFIWGSVALLLGLAALVWLTRREDEDPSTLLSLILGGVSTLGGYYQGHKDADAANERVRAAEAALLEMQAEFRSVREELALAKGALGAAVPALDENGENE